MKMFKDLHTRDRSNPSENIRPTIPDIIPPMAGSPDKTKFIAYNPVIL